MDLKSCLAKIINLEGYIMDGQTDEQRLVILGSILQLKSLHEIQTQEVDSCCQFIIIGLGILLNFYWLKDKMNNRMFDFFLGRFGDRNIVKCIKTEHYGVTFMT